MAKEMKKKVAKKKVEECRNCGFSCEGGKPRGTAPAVTCRRLPPVQPSMNNRPDPNPYPVVRADGWCGEYKA